MIGVQSKIYLLNAKANICRCKT